MKVYAFEYTSCIYESDSATISLHRTKASAYKAMRKHKLEEWNDFIEWKKDCVGFGENELWSVSEFEILD